MPLCDMIKTAYPDLFNLTVKRNAVVLNLKNMIVAMRLMASPFGEGLYR